MKQILKISIDITFAINLIALIILVSEWQPKSGATADQSQTKMITPRGVGADSTSAHQVRNQDRIAMFMQYLE